MAKGVPERDPLAQLSLPPGFRFYPTDEELLVDYLCRKVAGYHFSLQIIGEIDLYKFDPWVLPSKAMFGEKEWYFFSPRDRKYPNGSRPNRVAGSGYWKATGTDKIITIGGCKIGIKKALVFYVGKAPKGTKTNWIMHEYRLIDCSQRNRGSKLDVWVLCRIYEKNSSLRQRLAITSVSLSSNEHSNGSSSSASHLDDLLESLPDIQDQFYALPRMNSLKAPQQDDKLNLQNLGTGNFLDWTSQTRFNTVPDLVQTGKGMLNYNSSHNIDFYETSLPQMREMEEEVQSAVRTQRGVENATAGFVQHNTNMLNQVFPNTLDPFVFRYPAQPVGFGFGFGHKVYSSTSH